MVRVDTMDMMDKKLKEARGNSNPFGGCQIIAFGDLYQLPPVVAKGSVLENYMMNKYGNVFFFNAPVFKYNPLKIIELKEVHRQKDSEFIGILNSIRVGEKTQNIIDAINKRVDTSYERATDCISIVATNAAADKINKYRMSQLFVQEYCYNAEIEGQIKPDEYPADRALVLKVGAQVIMLKNDANKHWVNGSTGVITELTDSSVTVKIKGEKHKVDKEEWIKYEYVFDRQKGKLSKKEVGKFRQYPMRLAYAITVHKSQGQTYDKVAIDYSFKRAFAEGQTYVALSRCRTKENLYLKTPLIPSDIIVSKEVTRFMNSSLR